MCFSGTFSDIMIKLSVCFVSPSIRKLRYGDYFCRLSFCTSHVNKLSCFTRQDKRCLEHLHMHIRCYKKQLYAMRKINKLHHLLNDPWMVRIILLKENWMLTLLQRELYMYPSFFSFHSVVTNVISALILEVTISVVLPEITLCFWNLWTRIWKCTKLQVLFSWLSDIKKIKTVFICCIFL